MWVCTAHDNLKTLSEITTKKQLNVNYMWIYYAQDLTASRLAVMFVLFSNVIN